MNAKHSSAKVLFAVQTILLTLLVGALAVSAHEDDQARSGALSAPQPQLQQGLTGNQEQEGLLTPVGSGFTFQGQLKVSGNPANGSYDFDFRLYDAAEGGTQVGPIVARLNQTVT